MTDGVEIEDSLITALVECGEQAHRISQAHHLDPGSNNFTFGADRYHRATELSISHLEGYEFQVTRIGAGLRAKREGLELQFGTARGSDLSDKSNFDIDSSPARHRAAQSNVSIQRAFEGIDFGDDHRKILHVIWSGDIDAGLTAVYIGRLTEGTAQHLEWEEIIRVDELGNSTPLQELNSTEIPIPTYDSQPVPVFNLGLIDTEKKNVN